MSNPFEAPPQKTKSELEGLGHNLAEGLFASYEKPALEFSYRIMAAEAGAPIKPGDIKKFDFLKKEQKAFSEAFKKKPFQEIEKEVQNYKLPDLAAIIRKDKDGKLQAHTESIDEYKWAVAMAPPEKTGVRDFRKAKNFNLEISQSGRISFNTESQTPSEQFSYEESRLLLSVLGECQDPDENEYTILPYAHTDQEGKIKSKSIIILNASQRQTLRQFILEDIQKKI